MALFDVVTKSLRIINVRDCSYKDDFASIGTPGAVCCKDCLYLREFVRQSVL